MADSQRKSYNLFDVSELTAEYPLYVQYSNDTITIPYAYSGLYNTGITIPVEAPYTISCIPVVRDNAATNGRIRLVFADDSVEEIYITDGTATITAPIENTYQKSLKAIRFNWSNINNGFSFKNFMINSGSTAKPYEPYGWVHSLRKLTTATEAIENPLYSDGTAITSYTLKGNTVQSGTPTPSNPVSVQGVGNKTANLLYVNTSNTFSGYNCSVTTTANTSEVILNATSYTTDRICAITGLSITLKAGTYTACVDGLTKYSGGTYDRYYLRKSDTTVLVNNIMTDTPQTFTITEDTEIDRIVFVLKGDTEYTNKKIKLWVMEGSTALPYEPYGQYKIPILTTQGTSNIYLSEPLYKIGNYADVINADGTITRNIGHIKLGSLTWSDYGTNQFASTQSIDKMFGSGVDTMLCDTYICAVNRSTLVNNAIAPWNSSTSNRLVVQDNRYTTAADWIAAMGDVTLWYIAATPTTETVTAPSIPTTEGANSITVDTTVQPSEFTATWTGWHDSSVKEYDGTNWQ